MSGLVPRVYQEEAAREALQGNKIIRADTGSGKTLIAILLLKQITSTSSKLAVFLSPNVALVHQQAAAIEESTSLRVKTFVGADGVDYWKRERWVEQLDACNVAVMTPQVFLNLCDNAYKTFDQISLIIFDECHNCAKSHPSAVVMRNHYHPLKLRDPSQVPRILGLTASPIYNAKRPEKMISDLESVLDSRILEVASAAGFTRKAEERLVEHLPLGVERPLDPEVTSMLTSLEETGKLDQKATMRAAACQLLFGRKGLELYLSILAKDCDASHVAVPPLAGTELSDSTLSPKVTTLIKCLETFKNQPHFHAIVFVQQRHDAKILREIISLAPSLAWIKPGYLTGHGGRGASIDGSTVQEIGMDIKEQQETVRRFRKEELNLLVATRVAEEGLDFQACNVVIRFDSLQTITGYIQSRGRARAANALYVVIAEAGSEDSARYKRYVVQEEELKALYADRPEEDLDEPDLDNLPTYSTSTGALLTFQNSIPLLATFCSLLNRTDQFTPAQKPVYRFLQDHKPNRFQLTVPKIAALSQSTFVSDTFPTKKAARQQTAFDCCVALHQAGALDDYLLPVRETLDHGAKDALGREVDRTPMSKQVLVSNANPFGNVWEEDRAFLHVVEVEENNSTRRIGLLCATRQCALDSGNLFGRGESHAKARILEVKELEWDTKEERSDRLDQLETFNRLCVRIQLNRKTGDDERFYALWAPLTVTDDVDFSLVEKAFLPFDPSIAEGSYVVVPFRRPHARIGRFLRIRSDVTSASATALIISNPERHRRAVINKYSDYSQYLKVCYEFGGLEDGKADLIVEFEASRFSPYHLGPSSDQSPSAENREIRVFPSAMCRISTLPLDFWATFAMVPTLNRLFGARSIAALAIEHVGLPSIDIDQLAKALTTPLSRVGYDYEYLETLGDSFLKLATSIQIYLEFPASEEGRLSVLRTNSVDNRFLRQQCLKSGLDRFVQSFPLRWATFVPESADSVEVSEDGATITRTLSRKVLSDVVEAVLGAAYLTGGVSMAMETGTTLDLCFGGTSHWKERPSAKKLLGGEPVQVSPALKFLEDALGYKIKSKGQLLLQALTHRSFPGNGYCYEREEYLGDAILDWYATTRLFPLSESTTPRFLTFRRAMLVSNPTLALLAIRKLRLHKSILHNSPLLEGAIREAVEYAEKVDWKDVVQGDLIWVWSPPKVLGDVFESLLAVVFIDAGFDLEAVFAVLDKIYEDILPHINEKERRDPHSRLLMWRDAHACDQLQCTLVRTEVDTTSDTSLYTATIAFHSIQIAQQAVGTKTVARQLAAREALLSLEGIEGEKCDCRERKAREKRERLERRLAEEDEIEDEKAELEEKETQLQVENAEEEDQAQGEDSEGESKRSFEAGDEEQLLTKRVRVY